MATAKSASDCERMALEAIEGEEQLTDSPSKQNQLRLVLGLTKNKSLEQPNVSHSAQDALSKQADKRSKPFKRHPKRDPVGT